MTVNRILSKARSELGTRETGVNHVKYVDDYLGRSEYNGAEWPWCVIFLWWIFNRNRAQAEPQIFPTTAHCDGVRAYALQQNRWVVGDYKPGDCVIFDYNLDGSGDHIGIVEAINPDGSLETIEGNYSDRVMRVCRQPAEISGAFRPAYEAEPERTDAEPAAPEKTEAKPAAPALPELRNGDTGHAVLVLQTLLRHVYNISVGMWGTDGEFGPDTENAVKRFQARANINSTGVCDAETWKALLEGEKHE